MGPDDEENVLVLQVWKGCLFFVQVYLSDDILPLVIVVGNSLGPLIRGPVGDFTEDVLHGGLVWGRLFREEVRKVEIHGSVFYH